MADLISREHKWLRRYTTLPAVFELLEKKVLTLTNPSKWEDKNDQFTIGAYKTNNGFESVLAACFTGTRETFHHWKIFAPGVAGMCVVFRRDSLEKSLKQRNQVRFGLAKYRKMEAGVVEETKRPDLPFVKRIGYRDEQEYRIIWQSRSQKVDFAEVAIDPICIETIVINPWLPANLARTLRSLLFREVLRQNFAHVIKIKQSHLVESLIWKRAITKKFLPLANIKIRVPRGQPK